MKENVKFLMAVLLLVFSLMSFKRLIHIAFSHAFFSFNV